MKRLLIPLLLTPLFSFPQSVGTLIGMVSGDDEKLEFASVVLLRTDIGTNTDKQGYFELKQVPVGKYQLRISFIGYEFFQDEVEVKLGEITEVKVTLIELTSHLKEIVITGSLKEVTKLQSVTPVDVYTTKYFQRNPVNNIWDALRNVNGIFPDIDNGVTNTTDIQINGLEGNYSMILIDGVPAMNGLAGIYALNAIPMSMVEKIEILKGSASALYGSEAIAGVINIKTKSPTNTPKLHVNASLDSYLDANADITTSFRIHRATSMVSVSGQTSQYRWDLNKDNFMDIPLTNRISVFNKWQFDRKDSGLTYIYGRFLYEDRFGGQKDIPGRIAGNPDYYSEWIKTNQWQVGFHYQLPVKDQMVLRVDYSEHYQKAIYGISRFNGRQRTGFSQLTWNKKIDRVNDLLMGALYRLNYYTDNTGVSIDSGSIPKRYNHIGGVFIEDEMSFGKYHKLVAGVRFEYSQNAGPVFTPRINYKWNSKDEKHVVRIGVGTGYRVANLLNEGFGAMNGSRQIKVAEPLKPEYTISGNANYTRVQELKGGVLDLDASVFLTYFTNFIEPDYNEDPKFIVYSNNKRGAMSTGFSANAGFTFNYPLKIGIGFTYAYVFEIEEDESGKRERQVPEHSPPFTANFFFSYLFPAPQLSLDWTGTLISPMLLATVLDDFRPTKSPWYTIQNVQLTKKFRKGMEIYVGIKNLFNFIQKDPILRPFDPFNRNVQTDNPLNYRFDTTYGFTTMEGIKAFVGFRYTLL
ncbi:MAG: TonB-dependent receptor [Bacteroidetes bacterium]|nr:TonB-dependent receptor [Bacteroidota bacterium]